MRRCAGTSRKVISILILAVLLGILLPASALAEVGDRRARMCADNTEALTAVEDIEAIGAPYQWVRVAGSNALATMRKVVQTDKEAAFKDNRGGNVLIATAANYKDALACAGFAGMYGAPILITDGKSLSPETKAEIQRINPEWIGIVGGLAVVSTKVEAQLAQLSPAVVRIAGKNAVKTSVELFKSGIISRWDYTAIIVTGDGYKDALSIAPFAYWAWSPVFLANSNKKDPSKRILSNEVLSCLKELNADGRRDDGTPLTVIIVGGPKAVSSEVEGQLKRIGVAYKRIYGSNAIKTSMKVAQFALREGMGMSHLTVATTASYKDALCAVPVCGELKSIMVLCNPTGGLDAFNTVYDSERVTHGHVIGGVKAVSAANYDAIVSAE